MSDWVVSPESQHRLRTYIRERVKESRRLAEATVEWSIRNAHRHSMKVGESILAEIDAATPEEPK